MRFYDFVQWNIVHNINLRKCLLHVRNRRCFWRRSRNCRTVGPKINDFKLPTDFIEMFLSSLACNIIGCMLQKFTTVSISINRMTPYNYFPYLCITISIFLIFMIVILTHFRDFVRFHHWPATKIFSSNLTLSFNLSRVSINLHPEDKKTFKFYFVFSNF